jgi:membrane protein YdbS with pleckstrin-like domain
MAEITVDNLEPDEEIIFDKRHSLWEIWRNFLIGIGAIVVLVLLLNKFKPGPSEGGETAWGYIILISILSFLFLLSYGVDPFFKRRKMGGRSLAFPVIIMVLIAGAWIAMFAFRNNQGFSDIWTTLAWIAFFVVIAGWLVYPILKWYFTHFILTDRRLILSWGILNKKSKIIPLDQINDISSSQNLFERIFRYGDVVIESAGEFGQQPFTNIGDPTKTRTLILQQRRISADGQSSRSGREVAAEMARIMRDQAPAASSERRTPEPGAGAVELDVVEGLSKLDELRRSGALSEEEFQEAKRELLDRMRED